ncbi:MAG: NUDIX hydrolase [Candidatus Omnitrophota bacterium]
MYKTKTLKQIFMKIIIGLLINCFLLSNVTSPALAGCQNSRSMLSPAIQMQSLSILSFFQKTQLANNTLEVAVAIKEGSGVDLNALEGYLKELGKLLADININLEKYISVEEVIEGIKSDLGKSMKETKFIKKIKGELTDILNEQDEVVGVTEAGISHIFGLRHRTANAFVVTPNGELLLQRRVHNKAEAKKLSIFGGHVASGQSYEEAMRRELLEELSLDGIENDLSGKLVRVGSDGQFINNDAKNMEFRSLYVYVLTQEEYKHVLKQKDAVDQERIKKGRNEFESWIEHEQKAKSGYGEVWGYHIVPVNEIMNKTSVEIEEEYSDGSIKESVSFTSDLLEPLILGTAPLRESFSGINPREEASNVISLMRVLSSNYSDYYIGLEKLKKLMIWQIAGRISELSLDGQDKFIQTIMTADKHLFADFKESLSDLFEEKIEFIERITDDYYKYQIFDKNIKLVSRLTGVMGKRETELLFERFIKDADDWTSRASFIDNDAPYEALSRIAESLAEVAAVLGEKNTSVFFKEITMLADRTMNDNIKARTLNTISVSLAQVAGIISPEKVVELLNRLESITRGTMLSIANKSQALTVIAKSLSKVTPKIKGKIKKKKNIAQVRRIIQDIEWGWGKPEALAALAESLAEIAVSSEKEKDKEMFLTQAINIFKRIKPEDREPATQSAIAMASAQIKTNDKQIDELLIKLSKEFKFSMRTHYSSYYPNLNRSLLLSRAGEEIIRSERREEGQNWKRYRIKYLLQKAIDYSKILEDPDDEPGDEEIQQYVALKPIAEAIKSSMGILGKSITLDLVQQVEDIIKGMYWTKGNYGDFNKRTTIAVIQEVKNMINRDELIKNKEIIDEFLEENFIELPFRGDDKYNNIDFLNSVKESKIAEARSLGVMGEKGKDRDKILISLKSAIFFAGRVGGVSLSDDGPIFSVSKLMTSSLTAEELDGQHMYYEALYLATQAIESSMEILGKDATLDLVQYVEEIISEGSRIEGEFRSYDKDVTLLTIRNIKIRLAKIKKIKDEFAKETLIDYAI